MRTINAIHDAQYEPIADLVTYRAMPTASVPMNRLDPFIFLNHHGWQQYPPHNSGLPFGPHPHRGFETVTFILEGDLTHKDSSGGHSTIEAGGVQWMTAGSGLVHAEISSEAFKKSGGPLEILQLWVNLPARLKMTAPRYTGLQQQDIPTVAADDGKVLIHPVSGEWNGVKGPIDPLYDMTLARIVLQPGGSIDLTIPRDRNILLYIVKGALSVNGTPARQHQLVTFGDDDEQVSLRATAATTLLFGHAAPFSEPFVAQGPFVMNTREEIMQAYDDYNKGKFGSGAGF